MMKKILMPLVAMILLAMVGCTGNSDYIDEIVQQSEVYKVKIEKASDLVEINELAEEWDNLFDAWVTKYADKDLTAADEKRIDDAIEQLTLAIESRSMELPENMLDGDNMLRDNVAEP